MSNSIQIRTDITKLTLELNELRDAELYARLRGAEGKIAAAVRRLDQLTSDLNDAMAKDAEDAKAVRAGRFRNMRVTMAAPEENLLRAGYVISYEERCWDSMERAEVWRPMKISGFSGLGPEAYTYMMENCPEAIPERILKLAATPQEAMQKLFLGMRRGWM